MKKATTILFIIVPTIVLLAMLVINLISDVNNEFGSGDLSASGYVNDNIGLEVDFREGMAYAGSNVGADDYVFDILGTEWFRMHFMPLFAEGMDLQIRIRDISDMSGEFIIPRIIAEYRIQGFDFNPTGELNHVIRESGTRHGFSVYRRREWVMRDIADSISYLFVKRHGDVLVQFFIVRYSPEQDEILEEFLRSVRLYKPRRQDPVLVSSTPPTEPGRIRLARNRLSDQRLADYFEESNVDVLERYGEYLALSEIRPADIHGELDDAFVDGLIASQRNRLLRSWYGE